MSNELMPYAMKRARKISPVALDQLKAWLRYARQWRLFPELRTTEENHILGAGVEQLHIVCAGFKGHEEEPQPWGPCGTSIYVFFDGSTFNLFDVATVEALVVAHIRNIHRQIEEVVYNGAIPEEIPAVS